NVTGVQTCALPICLHTKMLQVAATALGVPLSYVRLAPTRTDKVPNSSATSASTGAALNAAAGKDACEQIIGRLAEVASGPLGVSASDVRFGDGEAYAIGGRSTRMPWLELITEAYQQRKQLFAAGYYRTEGIHWDAEKMKGRPFKY